MIFEKQQHIKIGFIDFNYNEWSQAEIDAYNGFTDCINNTAEIEIKRDSLSMQERDFYLDQRHEFFGSVIAKYQAEKIMIQKETRKALDNYFSL